jgi:hypothetical protein
MKTRISLLASILVLGCALVQAQSSYDIETRYGKRVNVYSVSENLWMSPSYDSQGQVCLMRVFPKTVSQTTNYLDPDLNLDETLKFINELFPTHTRGRREDGAGLSSIGGGVAITGFNYEHVRFAFISSFRITKLPEKSDEFVLLDDFPFDEAAAAEYKRQEQMKTDDQLMREHVHGARVLQIVWANRKCDKP